MAGQTIDFVSPGSTGFPKTTVALPISQGDVNTANLAGKFFPKKALEAGHAQVFRPKLGPDMQITIRGLNVVAEHWDAMDALLPGAIWQILNEGGQLMTKAARRTVPIDSGDTFRSIHHFMTTMPNATMVSVGPTTFYAPFIEYGLGGHSHIGPRPFMLNALHEVLPGMVMAFRELTLLAKRGAKYKFSTPEYASDLNSLIAKWRGHLYTAEKEIGDLIPIGGFTGLRGIRESLLGCARVLGDVQAVMGRVVGQRFARRLTGKVTGRLIGVGSRTIFVDRTISADFGVGQRAYNRVAGRAMTRYVDQTSLLRGTPFG